MLLTIILTHLFFVSFYFNFLCHLDQFDHFLSFFLFISTSCKVFVAWPLQRFSMVANVVIVIVIVIIIVIVFIVVVVCIGLYRRSCLYRRLSSLGRVLLWCELFVFGNLCQRNSCKHRNDRRWRVENRRGWKPRLENQLHYRRCKSLKSNIIIILINSYYNIIINIGNKPFCLSSKWSSLELIL